jgi:mono/diheme cytochrome c family protein
MDEGMMQRHMAPVPADYANLTNPVRADAGSLARGQAIYEANCAACHGDEGWGDGPAGANLNPPPAPLAHTAPMLSDAYLFYRISKGGQFAPFNSAMPGWKETLDETGRWDVINYIRSLGENEMMGDGMMGGMMILCWVLGGLLVAALVAALIWVIRRSSQARPPVETPLTILERRYAQGEIDSEQFETMRRQLSEEEHD